MYLQSYIYILSIHIFKIYLNRNNEVMFFLTMNNGFINKSMDVNVDLEHRGRGTKDIFYLEHVSVFFLCSNSIYIYI